MILHTLLDYDTLRFIWWLLIGVLLVGFAVTDGFDLGAGMLLPFAARNDIERRVMINSIGPVWEGNSVWLSWGGGPSCIWPQLTPFRSLALLRCSYSSRRSSCGGGLPVRSKRDSPHWRARGRACCSISGSCPRSSGVAVVNVLQGVPFASHRHANLYDGVSSAILTPSPSSRIGAVAGCDARSAGLLRPGPVASAAATGWSRRLTLVFYAWPACAGDGHRRLRISSVVEPWPANPF